MSELLISILEKDDADALLNLISAGNLNPSSTFSLKRSALHLAARDGATKCIEALIAKNFNKNAVDEDGNTPLMLAAMKGHKSAVTTLLAYGANPNLKQRGGRTALIFASAAGHSEIASILERAGASVMVSDEDGATAATAQNIVRDSKETAARSEAEVSREEQRVNGMFNAIETNLGKLMQSISRPAMATTPGLDAWAENLNQAVEMARGGGGGPVKPEKEKQSPNGSGASTQPKQDVEAGSFEESLKKLLDLGFENLTEAVKTNGYVGWEDQCETVGAMIEKGQNVMLVGESGTGKTSLAMQLAQTLDKDGKILLQLPSSLIRGNKYAGSVNENIQKWLPIAQALYPKVIIYIDKANVLSTGKTSSDVTDTPMQILKEHLDNIGPRIQVIGSVTPKELDLLNEDEAFTGNFANFKLTGVSKDKVLEMLCCDETLKRLSSDGYDMSNKDEVIRVFKRSADLLDLYIFNQPFPKKAFQFIKHLLTQDQPSNLTSEKIETIFSKFYSIPVEVIRGVIEESSQFLSLEGKLKGKLMGQDEVFGKLSQTILGGIMMSDAASRAPISFIMMGSTGVGKTESSETIAKHLDLPMLTLNMGQYKTLQSVEELKDQLVEFLKKHYSGIILFDEIEKSSPQVWDILLSLVDKGNIGSGTDLVKCGNQIIIATTNVGAQDMALLKKELMEEFDTSSIDEDWLRGRLVQEGMRLEMVSRFTQLLDFNMITKDVALKIGKLLFDKKAKEMKESKGVDISFADSFINRQILDEFDDRFGARGVIRTVNEAFKKMLVQKDVILKIRKGTSILVSEEDNTLIFKVTTSSGEVSEVRVDDSAGNDKQKTEKVIQNLQRRMNEMHTTVEEVKDAAQVASTMSPR